MMEAHEHITMLTALKLLKTNRQRRQFVNTSLPNSTVKTICEALYNISHAYCKNINKQQLKKLIKYKRVVRQLANKPLYPIKRKRDLIINQKGGFLPVVLPLILSALENVL